MNLVIGPPKINFDLGDEVSSALASGGPVVALESTVISHGLPNPRNLETARSMILAVRENGATPALVSVRAGRFRIGTPDGDLEGLSDNKIRKLSVRDLPIAAARKLDGATTVATTAVAAFAAGIGVFATGGIGGVHRGSGTDVSADLPVLAETPIVVVCSGAKAILDLPATREWLETAGVPIIGFGCDELPAFYSRESGLDVDERVETLEEAREIVFARDRIRMKQAVLLAVPVPPEDEIPAGELATLIDLALEDADAEGISGKEVTPFLLSRVGELSGGRTLRTNISLLNNNAAVAARLSCLLSERKGTGSL